MCALVCACMCASLWYVHVILCDIWYAHVYVHKQLTVSVWYSIEVDTRYQCMNEPFTSSAFQ